MATTGTLAIYNGTGCPEELPAGDPGQIVIQSSSTMLDWIDLIASNVPTDANANFSTVQEAIDFLLQNIGAVSSWTQIGDCRWQHDDGNGNTFTLDLNANALCYSNLVSGLTGSTVQAAIDELRMLIASSAATVAINTACNPALTISSVGSTYTLCLDLDAAGSYDNTVSGITPTSVQDAIDWNAARNLDEFVLTKNQDVANRATWNPYTLNIPPPVVARILSGATTVVPASVWVTLPPGGFTADYDTTTIMTSANPGLMTIPKTGRYTITAAAGTTSLNGPMDVMQARLTLNGSLFGTFPATVGIMPGQSAVSQILLPAHQFNAGDQIGMAVFANMSVTVSSAYLAAELNES